MGILDDKAILITGAASGIGEATALEAVAEGARVLLSDVDDAKGEALAARLTGDGATAVYVHADVTDEDQVEALVARTRQELGAHDGAFNCAGILGAIATVADTEYETWKRIIEVDLHGVFLSTKHQLRDMAAHGGGSIVNMSSAAGVIGWPFAAGYTAAKHGVVGLSKSAALEFATQNIRVNAVCPSYTETPMVADLFDNLLGGDQSAVDAALAAHPIGRFAQPREIAAACVWLLSDKASFVTATAFSVDGGYTAP